MIEFEEVGEAGYMPATEGFTMVVFRASDVPPGTKVFIQTEKLKDDYYKED